MKRSTLLSLMAALPLCAAAQNSKPNIILLAAEDLGFGDLSCYGAQRVATPAIDSLAANGVQLTICTLVLQLLLRRAMAC